MFVTSLTEFLSNDGWWSAALAGTGVVASCVIAWGVSRQQARSLRESIREQRSGLRLAWTDNVVDWGQCCIRTLSELDSLGILSANDERHASDTHRLLHLLSALIDEGRFFFANKAHGNYGLEKPAAYRGLSPKLIDCLKTAYLLIYDSDRSPNSIRAHRNQLIDIRREFVSELQREIDPLWMKQAIDYPEAPASTAQ